METTTVQMDLMRYGTGEGSSPPSCPQAAMGTPQPSACPCEELGAEGPALAAMMGQETSTAWAVPADHHPCTFHCRKTAYPAVSSTSTSARTGTASPCAGAAMLMPTAWTALMRKTVVLEVMAALGSPAGMGMGLRHGRLTAAHLRPNSGLLTA